MKRTAMLILSVLPAVFLLAGCMEIDIGIGIDEVYNSTLSYSISMDLSGIDPEHHEILENALNRLGWLYQENCGFTVGLSADSDIYKLTMRKTTTNNSFPEAFDSLKTMLTDESITAFRAVDMAVESFPRQDSYIISAMLDIPLMIKLSSAKELPPDLQAGLENALETSGGTITLTLPLSELAGSSHDIEHFYRLAVMAVPFDFTGQTEFELQGSVVYSGDGAQIGTTSAITEELDQTKTIVLIACGSALALLFIILLAVLLRRRRKYDW